MARRSVRRKIVVPGVAAIAGYAALHALGRGWGATRSERARALPGDGIVVDPDGSTTHAITIGVPPEEVWPWLVQMGYHRGGWYTYEWVDRYLFHMANPSAEHIVDELQPIAVGDIIPDGEPDTAWYVVDEVVENRHLVLHSTTHFPPEWRAKPELGVWVDWTWTFVLEPVGDHSTRLISRCRGACGPWWMKLAFLGAVIPADFVMARSQLRGIRMRAELADKVDAANAAAA